MGYNNGIVEKPIAMGDISSAVGFASLDLGTLITEGIINKWAKYKPVKSSIKGEISDTDRANENYGLTIQMYNIDTNGVPATMFADAFEGNTGWKYEAPRGKEYNEYFRMLDFDKYNRNAECPYFFENASIVNELRISVGQVVALPNYNMSITDIKGIMGFDNPDGTGYGFLYTKNNGSLQHIDAINSDGDLRYPITGDYSQVPITIAQGAGTYKICAYIRDNNRGSVGAILHPIGGLTIVVTAPVPNVVIDAYFITSDTKPIFEFTITKTIDADISAGYAYLTIYKPNGDTVTDRFAIPTLTNSSRSYNYNTGRIDAIQSSEIASWKFTYAGETVTG